MHSSIHETGDTFKKGKGGKGVQAIKSNSLVSHKTFLFKKGICVCVCVWFFYIEKDHVSYHCIDWSDVSVYKLGLYLLLVMLV